MTVNSPEDYSFLRIRLGSYNEPSWKGNLADSHAKRSSDPRTAEDIRKVLKGEKVF